MEPDRTYTMTIDALGVAGELVATSVINPATETVIAHAPNASRTQLDRAVDAARAALQNLVGHQRR